MTSHGVPPDAPPGQERCAGHWTPLVDTEPLRHTLPAGALHGLQTALPLEENVPNSHVVQKNNVMESSSYTHVEPSGARTLYLIVDGDPSWKYETSTRANN